jgi:hypothetical protein
MKTILFLYYFLIISNDYLVREQQKIKESRLNYMLSTIRLSEICDQNKSSRELKDNDSLYLHLIDKLN